MIHPLENCLLRSLSDKALDLLLPLTTPVRIPAGSMLYQAGERAHHAFFLTSGIASVLTPMSEGAMVEVTLTGREGLVGASQLMGPAPVPTTCFAQLSSTALRIHRTDLDRLFCTNYELHWRILEFLQQEAFTANQIAGCSRVHRAEARLARWLLMAQDRAGTSVLNLTQEFLSQMLSLQRTTVTAIAGSLHHGGLIEYARGRLEIVDCEGLKRVACPCYQTIFGLHQGLYKQQHFL